MSTQHVGVDAHGQLSPDETLPHPQVIQEAWQACVDVAGYEARCREELASVCSDEAATTARRLSNWALRPRGMVSASLALDSFAEVG